MDLWQRRRDLGTIVAKTRRLYLDVRFWNDLCDAELGTARSTQAKELLDDLRNTVASGELLCPVEFHVVEELHRQRIPEKRLISLRLVDELSQRTVLLSPPERLFLEVLRLVQGLVVQTPPTVVPLEEMWTRPMFALGHDFPQLESLDAPSALVEQLRNETEDEWWGFGFVELFAVTGPLPIDPNAKRHTAALLNLAKAVPANLFESFDATYWSEVRGALDAYLPELEEIWRYLFARHGADPDTIPPDQLRQSAIQLRRLLYEGAKKMGLRATVPTLHVGTTLYSQLQWDRRREYKGNDLFDFGHAEAALPYFDGFATDRPLISLVRQSGLTHDYACELLGSADQIMTWLSG